MSLQRKWNQIYVASKPLRAAKDCETLCKPSAMKALGILCLSKSSHMPSTVAELGTSCGAKLLLSVKISEHLRLPTEARLCIAGKSALDCIQMLRTVESLWRHTYMTRIVAGFCDCSSAIAMTPACSVPVWSPCDHSKRCKGSVGSETLRFCVVTPGMRARNSWSG